MGKVDDADATEIGHERDKNREPLRSLGFTFLLMCSAVIFFEVAYAFPSIALPAMIMYAGCLILLCDSESARMCWYSTLIVGFTLAALELMFFQRIFGLAAIVLWCVFAFWYGVFGIVTRSTIRAWPRASVLLVPIAWVGLEYFRSELYYLKFSWVTPGLAIAASPWQSILCIGQFATSGLVFVCAALICRHFRVGIVACVLLLLSGFFLTAQRSVPIDDPNANGVTIAGVQLEHPSTAEVLSALDSLHQQHADTDLFVLSEYTFSGPVPRDVRSWCNRNDQYLIVGGVDRLTPEASYNTAFVIDPSGEIVFKQAKSVPIQFFNDGMPARSQEVWESPFGKIAIPTCYDLSYTRVMDRYLDKGAQIIVNPTMDVISWGDYQHRLHSRIPIARSAEYSIPIFRLASSGVSIAVDDQGNVIASGSIPGHGDQVVATLKAVTEPRKPLDRVLGPFCVVLTGFIGVFFAAAHFRGWRQNVG